MAGRRPAERDTKRGSTLKGVKGVRRLCLWLQALGSTCITNYTQDYITLTSYNSVGQVANLTYPDGASVARTYTARVDSLRQSDMMEMWSMPGRMMMAVEW